MSETLPTAMTPEEWAKHGQPGCYDMFRGGEMQTSIEPDGFLSVNWDGAVYDQRMVTLTPGDRHALAALCLYDQPYGFTREDVKLLEDFNQYHDRPKLSDGRRYVEVAMSEDDFVLLRSLVARITALLPPE